jgi:N-methylhydantoinase A
MQSNGGTASIDAVRNHAVTTLLSGPAAGVVGAGEVATDSTATGDATGDTDAAGLVTFDMGGTSSDVSLVRDGAAERTTEGAVAGHPVRVPMVDVETVGAGGGSIARVDAGGALRVGPESAGAVPGPACYDRGGTEPTVTDANVALGYVGPDAELGGELPIDAGAAEEALADLAADADFGGGADDGEFEDDLDPAVAAARGVYRVANATMARTIRSVTVERGHDPREHALVAFGGAGPMHAAALADDLGVETVLVPRACGVLSAYGLLVADESHDAARTLRTPLADADPETVDSVFADLREDALARTSDPGAATVERAADARYAGQSFELTVDAGESFDPAALAERFHAAHERAYGYRMDEPVELVTLRATATVARESPTVAYEPTGEAQTGTRQAYFQETGFAETTIYRRGGLAPGRSVVGPAVVEGRESTAVVPPDWVAEVLGDGTLRLSRSDSQ